MHAFDDIRNKGVLSTYDTVYNEPLHRPLKNIYHMRTNFKAIDKQVRALDTVPFYHIYSFTEQILRIDHHFYTAQYIRTMVNMADEIGNLSPYIGHSDD